VKDHATYVSHLSFNNNKSAMIEFTRVPVIGERGFQRGQTYRVVNKQQPVVA
jgi:hypothetical protein